MGKDSFILTEEHKKCLEFLEKSDRNLFITGKAGTGKSSLIQYFRKNTKKKVVVLAPTGIAALNCRGQTIHSFFGFPPRIINLRAIRKTNNRIYKNIDTLVIDEISMVRADLLDGVERFLRLNGRSESLPFGGTQIVFVGDLFQLPPVITGEEVNTYRSFYESEYFFSANSFNRESFEIVELKKIFRQKEERFIDFLNKIRIGQTDSSVLQLINDRVVEPSFDKRGHIILCAVNSVANGINLERLFEINKPVFTYKAETEGDFPAETKTAPVDLELKLKVGARVLFVKNDKGRRWVNGTLGTVFKLADDLIMVRILRAENPELLYQRSETLCRKPQATIRSNLNKAGLSGTGVKIDGVSEVVEVEKEEWNNIRYEFDKKTGEINEKIIGTLRQFPLRLAWAITIHRSQGMSLERVCLDFSRSPFAHGQTYVALSRCRSLGGLVLTQKLWQSDILIDPRIVEFHRRLLGNS